MRKNFSSAGWVGVAVLAFVIVFLLLLPFYLGPDDLVGCGATPDNKALNDGCHQVDAIVAVSGGDTQARVAEAIKLYKNGWAPQLIFSGAAKDKSGPSNAQAMKRQAIASGVFESAILIEETSVNTHENALNTQSLIKNNDLHRVILVTSAYHQRRAGLEFRERADHEAIVVVNHPVRHDKQWRENWYLTPSGWWLAVGELVKIIGFYVSAR